jgi:hypothetical protein
MEMAAVFIPAWRSGLNLRSSQKLAALALEDVLEAGCRHSAVAQKNLSQQHMFALSLQLHLLNQRGFQLRLSDDAFGNQIVA